MLACKLTDNKRACLARRQGWDASQAELEEPQRPLLAVLRPLMHLLNMLLDFILPGLGKRSTSLTAWRRAPKSAAAGIMKACAVPLELCNAPEGYVIACSGWTIQSPVSTNVRSRILRHCSLLSRVLTDCGRMTDRRDHTSAIRISLVIHKFVEGRRLVAHVCKARAC